MCCRLTIAPLDPEIAVAVLALGLFTPTDGLAGTWERSIAEEQTIVRAIMGSDFNALRLELSPSVSHYSHHAEKRIASGVYFEIAAKYAEKVNGTIKQLSNVVGCVEGGVAEHILAQYPDIPMLWERVCPGFRETILGTSSAA